LAADGASFSVAVEELLERVARAYRQLAEAREDVREAIRAARASGETFEDIAEAAGVSRQAVSKMLRSRP
jgi:DNA-directed RNA polymerase specialized sigma24 family protein